jgi:hypothetical protein
MNHKDLSKKELIEEIKYYIEFLHFNPKMIDHLSKTDLCVIWGSFSHTFTALRKKLAEKKKRKNRKKK